MIFLDMDGVLADFDTHHLNVCGFRPTRWPDPETADWETIRKYPGFYLDLPLMPGAHELFRYAEESGQGVKILTGVPTSVDAADNHKVQWAARHFPGVEVICCRSRDKWRHGQPGDILVDDYLKYRLLWVKMGGLFVFHTSAKRSIRSLANLGIAA